MKKFFKRIIAPVLDGTLTRQERVFYLLALMALTAFAFAIAVTAALDFAPMQVAARVAMWLFFLMLAIASLKLHKTKIVIYVSATFLTFILLPFNFFFGGGIRGGCAIWNLFGLICVLYLIESNFKLALLAGNILAFGACCAVELFHPELLAQFDEDTLIAKAIFSTCIVSLIVFFLILFQNRIYKIENEKSLDQKKEIEELSLAQSRFFSSMSHEIRTPINTIIGLNEMILREDISEEVAEDAVRMQSAGKMLLALVNDILDMSKIEAGKMEIVPAAYDTGKMLSELVSMVWFSAKEKGLEFRLNIDGTIPARLIGDEMRIKQVLVNILNNAVKYTSKGGVTLSVQCEKAPGEDGAFNVIYSIADTGIGIKQENIPQLFNVFKRVDLENTRYIEGTGLGLSIVKLLVDLMGGKVDVNSVYTQGSTFIVAIPQKADGQESLDSAAIEARHGPAFSNKRASRFTAPKARVLIVDDNEANLLVAEKLLRGTEARIDTASSGAECLKKTRQARYHLIFMDHLMPEMDGIECRREIRGQEDGQNAGTPVVVLTANAGGDAQSLYRREGFEDVILKPVSARQLEDALLRHLPRELVKVIAEDEVNEVLESPFHSGRHKVPIMIATDYSADIPRELARKSGIALLPAAIETDKGEFYDMIELDQDGILRYIEGGGKKIDSVEHGVEEYAGFFAHCLAEAQRVIYIPISAAIVKHFDVACEAARSFSSVSVFDSWHLSSGLGLMALKAAELARQGAEPDEIIEELARLRSRVQTSFVVNDTKYLRDAGRISSAACKICDALLLHPVVSLKKGRMTVGAIKVGTENVFWKKYIRWVLQAPATIDKAMAFVTYVGVDGHKLAEIEREIRETVNFEKIYFQKASASISVNCGPGTFGVLFLRK